jgi:chromosome segregation ATPase
MRSSLRALLRGPSASFYGSVVQVNDGRFEIELAAAHSAVEQLARAGDLSSGMTSMLGELVRLVDVLASSANDGLYRLEGEVNALKTDVVRLEADVHRLEGTASAARTDSQSLRTEMRGFDRRDEKLDQSVSHIADRVTALEARR